MRSLIHFSSRWPSWKHSAAGARSYEILRYAALSGMRARCVSPAARGKSEALVPEVDFGNGRVVEMLSCSANDASRARELIDDDDVAIFDEFHVEEMFGAKVASCSPRTMRVLDTQDLHFLREGRRRAYERGASLDQLCDLDFMSRSLEADDKLCRELASIHRSDLTLVTSTFEYELLAGDTFRIPKSKLAVASLFYDTQSSDRPSRRHKKPKKHVCFIGNFRHQPNVACVRDLRNIVWPILEKRLPPGTELHCYGAFPSREHLELSRGSFKVLGQVDDQFKTLSKYRVLLAYLTFGAGVKGKIADAWFSNCAVVTTGIGKESMTTKTTSAKRGGEDFAGLWSNNLEDFVDLAVKAYHNGGELIRKGSSALHTLYDRQTNLDALFHRLGKDVENIHETRARDFTAHTLWSQSYRSTDYMSRYIELKIRFRNLQDMLFGGDTGSSGLL